jgi:uncharacterized beta-barrel protein YwiB (DUF1934 family)
MDSKILLSIKGDHIGPEGNNNSIELITEGRLYKKDDAFCIEYEESEISGMEGTRTLISVHDGRILLERSGSCPSNLIFEKGIKYVNSYYTPVGILNISIYPTKVEHNLGEDQGELDLRYHLDIGGRYNSTNSLNLKYNSRINE